MLNTQQVQTKKPIVCPECNETGVVEIQDSVVEKDTYIWDSKNSCYKLDYEDRDGYGDLYIECVNCGHRYEQEEYEEFASLVF